MSASSSSRYLERLGVNGLWPVKQLKSRRPRLTARMLRFGRLAFAGAQVATAAVATALWGPVPEEFLRPEQAIGLALIGAIAAIALRRSLYSGQAVCIPSQDAVRQMAIRAVLAAGASLAMVAVCAALLLPVPATALLWAAAWAALSLPLVALTELAAAWVPRVLTGASRGLVVIGDNHRSSTFMHALAEARPVGWHIIGSLRDDVAADMAKLLELVAAGSIDTIVLAIDSADGRRIRSISQALADNPVRICLGVDSAAFTAIPAAASLEGGLPIVDLILDPHAGFRGAVKRAGDVVVSVSLLLLLGPAMLMIAALVRLESPGPALFRQRRFGISAYPIEVLKFRSMRTDVADATGERRTEARDPRVTRLGRILRRVSLDELPQLINVLRGDMSLVGPRPHALHMKVGSAYYFEAVSLYGARHRVKPGITGWAQVNGSRGEVDSFEKAKRRVDLDLWYIQNWSLSLDLRILCRTLLGGFVSLNAD